MKRRHAICVQIRRATALAVVGVLILSVASPIGTATAAGTTAVTLASDDSSIGVGETTTFDVAVDSSGGVGAAELGVELDDPSVATITDISVSGSPSTSETDISSDGSAASAAYFGVDSANSGDVTIVTVTVEGSAAGSTDLSFIPREGNDAVVVFDETGASYTISDTGSATLSVVSQDDGSNTAPTADAGSDQTVEASSSVTLDASGSDDSDGSIASYEWNQTGGPTADLADATSAQPTLTAPDVTSETTLTYEVTVTEDDGVTDSDSVAVTVTPSDVEPPTEPGDSEIELAFEPSDQTVSSGTEATADVVVANVDDGVGAAELTLSVDDAAVASITGVEVQGNPDSAFVTTSVSPDGATATVEYATSDTANEGDVPIVTLSLQGGETGAAALSVDDAAVYNESGAPYEVSDTPDATITVEDPSFSVSNLTGPETLTSGETGIVSATITNDGAVEATKTVSFTIGGDVASTESVTLDAGDSTTVEFDLSASELGTQSYGVSTADDSQSDELTVVLPVVGNSDAPPTDPDGNGQYEDLNGDGAVDVGDVQTLFANHDDPAIQQHVGQFDYNGDGVVDVGDVQYLFTEAA